MFKDYPKIIVLGCSDSKGVPRINCNCKVCNGAKKGDRNSRTRTSILLCDKGGDILIDAAPELRIQLTRIANAQNIRNVIFTHAHSDHISGYDDLINGHRLYNKQKRLAGAKKLETLNIWGSEEDLQEINCRFPYIKESRNYYESEDVQLNINIFRDNKKFTVSGWEILPIKMPHGRRNYFYALKFSKGQKSFVYICDIVCHSPNEISQDAIEKISGSDVLIMGFAMLNPANVPGGFLTFGELINLFGKIKSKNNYLVHVSHKFDYYNLPNVCGKNVKLAYDGMEIKL